MIGNAVPVNLAEFLATTIKEQINLNDNKNSNISKSKQETLFV